MRLIVRRTLIDEAEQVSDLLAGVSGWLASRGIAWLRTFPGPIPERIRRGEVWSALMGHDGPLVATVSVDEVPDPELWGPQSNNACYVHRLAVKRSFAGKDIGAALLDFASDLAVRQRLRWVRLDCNKDNQQLQNYYRRNGFTHVRTVDLPHRISGALFEREAHRYPSVSEVGPGTFEVTAGYDSSHTQQR